MKAHHSIIILVLGMASTPLMALNEVLTPCKILQADFALIDEPIARPIRAWKLAKRDVHFDPGQFFPKDYLKALHAQFKVLPEAKVTYEGGVDAFAPTSAAIVEISIAGRMFMRFGLFPGRTEKAVTVERLRLEDPLNTDMDRLGPTQNNKGLPLSVFRHARKQLFELAKAGGYTSIESVSQQHFGVMKLYEKLVGMAPATPEAIAIHEGIEKAYRFARQEMPEAYRPKDVDAFSRLLGSSVEAAPALTEARRALWQEFQQSGMPPAGMEILKNAAGEPMAVAFAGAEVAGPGVAFLTTSPTKQVILLEWRDIAAARQLILAMNL